MNTKNGRCLTNEEQNLVVAEAKTWVGTKYHHMADIKGAGVDCAMILIRVYCDTGIAPKMDPRPYVPQWYLHQSEEIYLNWIKDYCEEIDVTDAKPADLLLYRFGRCAAHGSIVIDDTYMIHAYQPAGAVEFVERTCFKDRFDSAWSPRIEA